MNKRLYRTIAGWLSIAFAAGALVASCEYPFNVELKESSKFVVIEASIQAGESSVARINYSSSIFSYGGRCQGDLFGVRRWHQDTRCDEY